MHPMKIRATFILVALSATQALSHAAPVEVAKGFSCLSSHKFDKPIGAFIQARILSQEPFDTTDGILSFAANEGFTAFGYPLVSVESWDTDSTLFGRLPGTAPPVHFSLVVRAVPWKVRGALKSQGIAVQQPRAKPAYPYIIVEGFNFESQEALPAGADEATAYSRVTCYPRL
jgi:hypothetical protein